MEHQITLPIEIEEPPSRTNIGKKGKLMWVHTGHDISHMLQDSVALVV
jgi:hypothetical protein